MSFIKIDICKAGALVNAYANSSNDDEIKIFVST